MPTNSSKSKLVKRTSKRMLVSLEEWNPDTDTRKHISEWEIRKHHKREIHKLLKVMFDEPYYKVRSNPKVIHS